jgi:hypothetical protein
MTSLPVIQKKRHASGFGILEIIGTPLACVLKSCAVLLGAFALVTTASAATQHALLIGIADYPGKSNDLRLCVDDCKAMKTFLTKQFQFPETAFTELYAANATSTNVVAELDAIVAKAAPGDAVIIYYSGHGTQVADEDGDEKDDTDEMICTYDADPTKPETWVTDDVFRASLAKLKTNRCLVMFDSCHSGTGTRGFRKIPGAKYRHLGFDRSEQSTRSFAMDRGMKAVTSNGNHVFLAACGSDQVARELKNLGGLFTRIFLGVATDQQLTIDSIKSIINRRVAKFVAQSGHPHDKQTPQYEGNTKLTLAQLLAPAPTGTNAQPAPTTEPVSSTAATPVPDQTAPTQSAAPPVNVTMNINKAHFKAGENVRVKVKADQDAHLRIYYIDGEQKAHMIFPNKLQQSTAIKGSTPIELGGQASNFRFETFFPKSQQLVDRVSEQLIAVVSAEPFTDEANDRWEGDDNFISFGNHSRKELRTRGLNPMAKATPGEAQLYYTITRKK